MIDSEWFYRQLEREGRSLRDMASALSLDPSAVSRMLRGERKMSAEEQDRIADYLGVSLVEVAARRRGVPQGFAKEGQTPFVFEEDASSSARRRSETQLEDEAGLSFYERVRGCMKGTLYIPPGVDLTEPPDPDWAKVYDDD